MTAILKSKHRVRTAKDFLENFVGHPIIPPATSGSHAVDRNHYLFIGRSREWPTDTSSTPPTSDIAPPAPLDTVNGDYRIWDNMISLKRIDEAFVSLVIPRNNWDVTGNTVYAQYDDLDPFLHNHPTEEEINNASLAGHKAGPLIVVTDDFHVFKCLSNNNGALSTEKPTLPGGSPWIVETSDGYKWKYMFTIKPADVLKFVTDQWIPVKTLGAPTVPDDGSNQWDVENDAIDGSIDNMIIINVGNNYIYYEHGGVFSLNGETPTGASLQGIGPGPNDVILSASASSDVGAYVNTTIYIAGQSPNKIVAYDETTKTATLENPHSATGGEIYDIWPTVNIDGNGTNATAVAIIQPSGPNIGQLREIIMTNVGQGYRYATASIEGGVGPGGTIAQVRPALSPIGGHGKDAENECGAFFVMVNTRLKFDEADFPVANDYRQIGIVRNVEDFGGGTLSTDLTRSAVKTLILSSVTTGIGGQFQPDEDILGSDGSNPDANAKIVEFKDLGGGSGSISFWQDPETGFKNFVVGMTITGLLTGSSATIDSIVDEEIQKYTGDIISIEHRRPILRAPDQLEDIKFILEF